jgi:hypothetical protein
MPVFLFLGLTASAVHSNAVQRRRSLILRRVLKWAMSCAAVVLLVAYIGSARWIAGWATRATPTRAVYVDLKSGWIWLSIEDSWSVPDSYSGFDLLKAGRQPWHVEWPFPLWEHSRSANGRTRYVSVSIAPIMLAAGLVAFAMWRSDLRRMPPGACPQCGYDRAGLAFEAPCPECGHAAP